MILVHSLLGIGLHSRRISGWVREVSSVFIATPILYPLSLWKKYLFTKPAPGAKKFGDWHSKCTLKIPCLISLSAIIYCLCYLMHCFRGKKKKKGAVCCAWMVWGQERKLIRWPWQLLPQVQYGNLLWALGNGVPGSCFACVYEAALLDPTAFQQQEGLGRNVGRDPRTFLWLLLMIMDSRWSEAPIAGFPSLIFLLET